MEMFEEISKEKLDRHQRFWNKLTPGEGGYLAFDPKVKNDPILPPYKDLEELWYSSEYSLKRMQDSLSNHVFLQDAIPTFFVNLGPGAMAPLLGGGYQLQDNTIWFDTEPNISDFTNIPPISLNRDHLLYRVVKEKIDVLVKESHGAYKVSFSDIGGTLDIIASLRGSQDLLMDLVDYPDEILELSNHIDRIFIEYFNEQVGWLKDCGYTGWIPLVHDKTWYPLQCDASAMISPAMFEKLVLPSLEYTSSHMDTSVYHLDGPGEIVHLDMILSVPNIHAIQWVPLPAKHLGNGRYHQCFDDQMSLDIYRRCLAAGKKVVLCGVPAYQIEHIFREVGSDGVFIFGCDANYQEAVDLIHKMTNDGWIRP